MTVKIQDFEDFLEEKFIELNEIGGMPITKDNCESMFETWLENRQVSDMMSYADFYGKQMYIQGARDYIAEQLEKLNKK